MVAFPEHFGPSGEEIPDLKPFLEDFSVERLGQRLSLEDLALLIWIEVMRCFPEQYVPGVLERIYWTLSRLLEKKPVHWETMTDETSLHMAIVPRQGTWNASYRLSDRHARIPELSALESFSENVFLLEQFPEVLIFVLRQYLKMALCKP